MRSIRTFLAAAALTTATLAAAPAQAIQLNIGDILVADDPSGSETPARIVRFNPATGASDVISSGGFLDNVSNLTLDNQGRILATCILNGLVRINPADGSQTVVSADFFQGGFGAPLGLTVAPSGNVIVATDTGRIIEVDPSTGAKTVRATLPSAASGVALRGDDVFIVSNPLQRFNITTGAVTPVPAGGLLSFPRRIAIDQTGYGYVVDFDSGLMGVDLETGEERFVSSGDLLFNLADVRVGANNRPVCATRTGELVEIDPDNFGEQILLTLPGQHLGNDIIAMEIVTTIPAPSAFLTLLSAAGAHAARRRR